MTAAQAGQDPAPQEPERVELRYGLYATYILREKPAPPPEPEPWKEGDPPPWGPVGYPAGYFPQPAAD